MTKDLKPLTTTSVHICSVCVFMCLHSEDISSGQGLRLGFKVNVKIGFGSGLRSGPFVMVRIRARGMH